MDNSDIILEIRGLSKFFANVKVLNNINFTLKKGEVLGLVGENGAGKSTLMNVLSGVYRHEKGEMYLNGERYVSENPLQAQKQGIAFIHQELALFSNLSVVENMFIEELPRSKVFKKVDYKNMKTIAKKYFSMLKIDINVNSIVGDLPMGKRQMVEIAKAISKKAQIIIFDEPTTSLSNVEIEQLFEIISQLKKNGTSIIYISHVLNDIFRITDRISVLRDGTIQGTDDTRNLEVNQVIKMMVGRDITQQFPSIKKNIGDTLLEIKNLTQGNQLKEISFSIMAGEIVGLYGLMGAGRTELAKAIFGVDKFDFGEVLVDGQKVSDITPQKMISKGIALITDNRREEGLLMIKSVKENLSITVLDRIKKRFNKVDTKQEDIVTEKIAKSTNIKTYDMNKQTVMQLSGGNQQKVVLGKWFLTNPKILILDEPTKGVDVGAKYEIYSIINENAKNGSAILFISSEIEELIGMCDRILVLGMGQIAAELKSKVDFVPEKIIKSAIEGRAV